MGESIPLGAPVPVEQAVLETFFSHLGIFSYDKAKDNVEKEREANKSAGASWLALLAGLAHLAAAEKAYHSMTFLGQKLGTAALGPRTGPNGPPRCSGSRCGGEAGGPAAGAAVLGSAGVRRVCGTRALGPRRPCALTLALPRRTSSGWHSESFRPCAGE